MRFRQLALVAAVATAALAACQDPIRPRATLEIAADTLRAFALTGTPIQYPSALRLVSATAQGTVGPAVVRIDTTFAFDLVFDVDESGQPVLIPPRVIAGAQSGARRVGLQTSTTPFDSLLRAPQNGYTFDTALVVTPGTPVLVKAESPSCNAYSPFIYAKLVVDSVVAPTREIFFRTVVDPNCGFRSLTSGIPTS